MTAVEGTSHIGCAQTNVQLYNQLVAGGWSDEDLSRARGGYKLALQLFGCCFRPMEKPFVSHLVGVASLLDRFEAPPRSVLAGLVHAAYLQGDFGTRRQGARSEHRERVRGAIGPEAEELVERYARRKDSMSTIGHRVHDNEVVDGADRDVLLIELMNTLEEHHDHGLLYCRKAGSREKRESRIARSVELANLLDRPDLADELRFAIKADYDAERPAVLVTDHVKSFTVRAPPRWRATIVRVLRVPGRALRSAGRAVARARG